MVLVEEARVLVLTGLELSMTPAKPISQPFVGIVDELVEALAEVVDVLEEVAGERLGSIGVVPDVFVALVDVLLVLAAVSSQFCNAECVNMSARSRPNFCGFVASFNLPRTGIYQIHPSPSLTT